LELLREKWARRGRSEFGQRKTAMVMLKKQLKYIQQIVKDTFNVITSIKSLKVVTNEKGGAVGDVLTIIC
jgi:hypothetical protein